MTTFAKSIVFVSGLIVAVGWLADGGSVDNEAAGVVQQFDGNRVF